MNHIAVLGATGGTGVALLNLMSARPDIQITALTRQAAPPPIHLPIRWLHGDATDPDVVRRTVAGANTIVSLVAAPRHEPVGTTRSDATRAILIALDGSAPTNLVVVSALGGSGSRTQQSTPARWVYARAVGADRLREVDRQESLLLGSGIPANVVRPPKLDDRPASGYLETSARVGMSARLSRNDLARCLADLATGPHPETLQFRTVVSR